MPEWNSPLWLAGLVAVPLVWWLHRFRRQGVPHVVSALFLWTRSTASTNSYSRATSTNPWWRLRALLVTLLVFGLAGPHWPRDKARTLEIWFDDSPSLQTLEDGTPRVRLALAALDDALAQHGDGAILVHSLGDPGQQLRLEPGQRDEWITRLDDWLQTTDGGPSPPTGRQMSPRHEHWLISDGADPRLDKWLEAAPLSRIIQVGQETENVAVRRLALRPDTDRPGRIRGLVEVENLGRAAASRQLLISAGQQTLAAFPVQLAAGEQQRHNFSLEAMPTAPVEARITPADSLPIDDTLVVDPQSFTALPVQVGGACAPRLHAALASHAGLRIVGTRGAAELRIACGPRAPRDGTPTIWLHTTATAVPVTTAPLWLPTVGPLRQLVLQPAWLRRFLPAAAPVGSPWLHADKEPLVVHRSHPQARLEILIDMAYPPWTRRPEYPLFIAGLIDRLLERPLLDVVGNAARSREASLISPRPLRAPAGETTPAEAGTATGGQDLGLYFILGAALLLGLDLRRQLNTRRPSPGTPSP